MMDASEVLDDLDQLRSRYEILRRLGRDGEHVVYAVRSPNTDRHLLVELIAEPDTRDSKPGTLLLWQAHTIARFDHPKLIPPHAVHHLQGGAVAIAMERRRGNTLAERIAAEGALEAVEAEAALRDLAEAIGYLHGRGVVHREIGPRSVFFDRDSGHARLCAFGIDRGAEAEAAPPPIRRDAKVSVATDVRGLGVAGYAMLTGQVPPPEGAIPPLASIRTDLPAHLCRAIEGCLQEKAKRRWSSVDEFIVALDLVAVNPRGPDFLDSLIAFIAPFADRLGQVRPPSPRLVAAGTFIVAIAVAILSTFGGVERVRVADDTPTAAPVRRGAATTSRPAFESALPVDLRDLGPTPVALPVETSESPSERDQTGRKAVVPTPRSTPPRPAPPRDERRPAPAGYVLLGEPIGG